eukprot:CAMPEP_0201549862 /NCGR_PEP_ID=MMETSP0173_2-20130828/6290_1 /ASSEMBLY_ACC=CAM_ASM_000268 /TAXON_ID=218659 /ORGANISM="Vexillifera sp., Strain DIVA3 564/2" /LENGTH=894 /DNA_ID=CAMNT_0047959687 /DNA_START=24 /DNA_END=2708 /DNA_ORIENTATION=+
MVDDNSKNLTENSKDSLISAQSISNFTEQFVLPKDEQLVGDFGCACQTEQDKVVHHGRMYITNNRVCFYSGILGEYKQEVHFREVKGITRQNTAYIFPNAIELSATSKPDEEDRKLYFTSFLFREEAFTLLFNLWQRSMKEFAHDLAAGVVDSDNTVSRSLSHESLTRDTSTLQPHQTTPQKTHHRRRSNSGSLLSSSSGGDDSPTTPKRKALSPSPKHRRRKFRSATLSTTQRARLSPLLRKPSGAVPISRRNQMGGVSLPALKVELDNQPKDGDEGGKKTPQKSALAPPTNTTDQKRSSSTSNLSSKPSSATRKDDDPDPRQNRTPNLTKGHYIEATDPVDEKRDHTSESAETSISASNDFQIAGDNPPSTKKDTLAASSSSTLSQNANASENKLSSDDEPTPQDDEEEQKPLNLPPIGQNCKHSPNVGEYKKPKPEWEVTFPLPIKEFWKTAFSDKYWLEFHENWSGKWFDFELPDWSLDKEGCCWTREVRFMVPLSSPIGPPQTRVWQTQRAFWDSEQCFTFTTRAISKDVPYGNQFTMDVVWVAIGHGDTTTLSIRRFISWSSRPWGLGSVIESKSMEGTALYFVEWIDTTKQYVANYVAQKEQKQRQRQRPVKKKATPKQLVTSQDKKTTTTPKRKQTPVSSPLRTSKATSLAASSGRGLAPLAQSSVNGWRPATPTQTPAATTTTSQAAPAVASISNTLMIIVFIGLIALLLPSQIYLSWHVVSLQDQLTQAHYNNELIGDELSFVQTFVGILAQNITGNRALNIHQHWELWKQGGGYQQHLHEWREQLETLRGTISSSERMLSSIYKDIHEMSGVSVNSLKQLLSSNEEQTREQRTEAARLLFEHHHTLSQATPNDMKATPTSFLYRIISLLFKIGVFFAFSALIV